jgi:hypothetical protein
MSLSSLIYIIEEPGKTPVRRLDSSGISSAISFGTSVSQRLLINMFYSHSTVISLKSFNLAFSDLFKLPALTNTLFRALRPKS